MDASLPKLQSASIVLQQHRSFWERLIVFEQPGALFAIALA